MKDLDIRKSLIPFLEYVYHYDDSTKYFNELSICQGECRIDFAVINGLMLGYEIKSERDTLKRLPIQSELYSKVFDNLTLIVSEKHIGDAIKIIPEFWGIMLATKKGDYVNLEYVKPPQLNVSKDSFFLAQFLWKEELIHLLNTIGLKKGLLKLRRPQLWKIVSDNINVADLSEIVKKTLKSRANYQFGHILKQCDDLSLLKPM